jgi:hypothetical protein
MEGIVVGRASVVWRRSDAAFERVSNRAGTARRVGMTRYGVLVYSPADPTTISLFGLGHRTARVEAGFAFQPGSTATTIRGDVVSAGPFHDGPPAAAGFFVIEAADLDVALAIARADPATRDGGVEVRPLVD